MIVQTTYGRILFNTILPRGMDFYNKGMKSGDLAGVISDCYQLLGRSKTINLLDDMMQIGFREATHSGLSFATDDLITPNTKVKHIAEAEKQVMRFKKLYERGVAVSKDRAAGFAPGCQRLPRPAAPREPSGSDADRMAALQVVWRCASDQIAAAEALALRPGSGPWAERVKTPAKARP